MSRVIRWTVLAGVVVGMMTMAAAAQGQTVLSLKVSKETAPPGGMAQVKVFITEPQPITTGGGRMLFEPYSGIEGIALVSPANDTYGVAVVDGTALSFSLLSPSATFGMDSDYPVLAVAGLVRDNTPIGTKFPLTFDTLSLADPSGSLYATDVRPGHLVAQPGLSIADVKPGSADLPAGAVVSIFGSSFEPRTKIKFKEGLLSAVRYVSSTQMDVVLALPLRMHGTEIEATNPDGSRAEYFSYERTARDATRPSKVFGATVPIFPFRTAGRAGVTVAGAQTGLAVQNIDTDDATVTAELVRADGAILGTRVLTVPKDRFVLLEMSELFGGSSGGATICVSASSPVQTMGVAVDSAGAARPIVPAATLPSVCQ